jgi:hypothetical protein
MTRRIAMCHLLLRGTRWMPVSVNKKLGSNDRCAPGGPVISAVLCAVVAGDAVVGWTESSGFTVREIGADGTLAPLDFKPAALALDARYFDTRAAAAGAVGISSLIAERRISNKRPAIFLQSCAKPHSSALKYRYSTSFKGILLLEFCFSINIRNESAGAARRSGRDWLIIRFGTNSLVLDGQSISLCPGTSDLNFLRHLNGIVNLDAKISNRALDLRVAQ